MPLVGEIAGISLSELLQVAALAGERSLLEIRSGKAKAWLAFEAGAIVRVARSDRGRDASPQPASAPAAGGAAEGDGDDPSLAEAEAEKKTREESDLRRSQIGTGDRSEKIRTYNFPQDRVTDHRIKLSVKNLPGIMEGEFDRLISPLAEADNEAKLLKLGQQA